LVKIYIFLIYMFGKMEVELILDKHIAT
jgi:hypothetical protein